MPAKRSSTSKSRTDRRKKASARSAKPKQQRKSRQSTPQAAEHKLPIEDELQDNREGEAR